ncbi:PrpF domain-containing protein [Streptomyces sp. A5-4]|uniref:PrpF domain-containing protein n=1 Tax=Streptomyces sp. A5-4 TaxID=3384771 RepID=UPI003DA83D68
MIADAARADAVRAGAVRARVGRQGPVRAGVARAGLVRADVVRAEGAPGPTLVINRDHLPAGALALRAELTAVRQWLESSGRGAIRKIALYGTSADPAHDLDYRFVQCLPDGGFDFRSGCGHSVLACVVGARRGVGATRVRVANTGNGGDTVVCEPAADGSYTVHFDRSPALPLAGLLPTGTPVQRIGADPASVSVVSLGNPYVFVDAAELGLRSRDELFDAGTEDFVRLLRLRAAAARLLGHPPRGALPKIAAVGAYRDGRLAVRAPTVPGWHPALALTGAVCLAAATTVPGTLPNRLARTAGCATGALHIETPGGAVVAAATPTADGAALRRVSVYGKRAHVVERAVALPWRIHVTA